MASFPYALTVVNPGAETGVNGWTNSVGTLTRATSAFGLGAPHSGTYFFFCATNASSTHCYQDVAVPSDALSDVDAEGINARLTLWQAGAGSDRAQPYLEFYNVSSVIIGTRKLGADYAGTGTWVEKEYLFRMPTGTRTIRIGILGTRSSANELNAYWDDVTLGLEQSNLVRGRVGLVDYFLPGTKAFNAADWTPVSDASVSIDGGTGALLLDPGTSSAGSPKERSAVLHTVEATSGGYVMAEVRRDSSPNTGVIDLFTSITDQTLTSEDSQGARFTHVATAFPTGDTKDSGNTEWVAGTQTVFGTTSVNLASGVRHFLSAWVEPGNAAPACLAKKHTVGSTTTDFTHGGPMSRELVGKPGIGVGSSGHSADLQVFQFFETLDRYIFVRGQTTGRIAKVRDSAGAIRPYSATVDGDGEAAIDLFGDETPLSSFDVCTFESDGVTPVDVIHPTDDPVVWAGDILSPPWPVADFSLVATGLLARLTDRSEATAPSSTIVGWAYRFWETSDPGTILGTSEAQNPTFAIPVAGNYTFGLIATDSNGIESDEFTRTQVFGEGTTSPPYDLPTEKIAGRVLMALDNTIDWTGKDGVVFSTEGRPFLDMYKVPTPALGRECRLKNYEISDHADQPTRTFRADLALNGAAGSFSVLATNSWINRHSGDYSAAVYGAREVWVQNPLGDPDSTDPADWKPRFQGYMDDPKSSWSGNVGIFARDIASALQVEYRGPAVWIGVEGGTLTLGAAIQEVLDKATRPGLHRLKVVGDLDWDIDAFVMVNVSDVLQLISDMARQRGAVVRWWYDTDTERFQLTLFVLQVDKSTPDFSYAANETKDAPESSSDTANVRNDIYLDYVPAGQTVAVTLHRGPTQAEIVAYRLKPLWIGTEATKHIKDAAAAGVMMDYIDGAVRLPATMGSRIRSPRNSDIEINSLIYFGADGRIADEGVALYCSGWTERVSAIAEAIQDEIETLLRNGPAGQIRQWLRRIAGLPDDTTASKLPPTWKYLTRTIHELVYDTYKLVAWCRLETHGLAILDTRAQKKLPTAAWGQFGAPDRVAGDYSEVHERTLEIGEFEHDVALVGGDAISMIRAEINVEGIATPLTLFEVSGDANSDPDMIDVRVSGTDADAVADDDSKSLHALKISGPGSSYSDSFDSNLHTFSVPVPAGEEWEVDFFSKNTFIADPDDLVSEPIRRTIRNSGEPTIAITAYAPADGSGLVTIDVQASLAPAGYTFRLYRQYQTHPLLGGAGSSVSESDITAELSPSPVFADLPTTLTTYDYATPLVRDDSDPEASVVMQFRATVFDADGVAVPDTVPHPNVATWAYRIPT